MDKTTLAKYLDFANHHQDATPKEIGTLCQEVKEYGFHGAFVNPAYVLTARELLPGGVVGTVVSFPLGQETKAGKIFIALEAVRNGASELDVSMNVGLFKAGKDDDVLGEMKEIVLSVKEKNPAVLIKFIIETGCLDKEEIKRASQLVVASGADFVKTSSGWGPRGASLEDVELIKSAIGDKVKIKVAGGVDTYQEAVAFIEKGAARIGTSHAVAIVEGSKGV